LKLLIISNISLREINSDIVIFTFYLKKLIYLDGSYNNILTMNGINQIKNLIYLDLKFNIINEISIDFFNDFNFNKLNKLEYINLNKSIAKNLINFELKFGNKLERAIISSNDLTIFPKFCEQDATISEIVPFSCNLKMLYFDHNKLTKIHIMNFIYLEKLEYLNLDSNNIDRIEDDSFYNLISLETLILSNNKLNLANNTEILFSTLTNIKFLYLSCNRIELIQSNTFSNLLKLEVLDLSSNKIRLIKENSFIRLINLRDLYINENLPNMKLENSSFNQFDGIKTIFIDRSILNDSLHKTLFIKMANYMNILHRKKILNWNYYPAFNLIALNETFYDCGLVFELIKFNIQYNLKTESDYSNYLSNCQLMKIKDVSDKISEDGKLEINVLYMFLVMVSFSILILVIWIVYSLFHNHNSIQFKK